MEIVRDYRYKGDNLKAYELGLKEYEPRRIKMPNGWLIRKEDINLFKELYVEFTIVMWYIGKKEEAKYYYDESWLVFGHKFTTNMAFYIDKLNVQNMIRLGDKIKKPHINDILTNPECYPCNPSIVNYKDGYIISLRLVNYNNIEGYYHYHQPDNTIRTKNMLIIVNSNFEILKTFLCLEKFNQRPVNYTTPWQGLEDMRLYWTNEKYLGFSGSSGDTDTYQIKMSIGKFEKISLDQDYPDDEIIYYDLKLINSPTGNNVEKNWVYWNNNTFIYSYYPFLLYNIDTSSFQHIDTHLKLIDFRGSTAPIPYNSGQLIIVHSHFDGGFVKGRTYIHRFLWFDTDNKIQKLSWWFFFRDQGVEFATGLVLSHDQQSLIISFGFHDNEDWFASIPISTVSSLLFDCPYVITV